MRAVRASTPYWLPSTGRLRFDQKVDLAGLFNLGVVNMWGRFSIILAALALVAAPSLAADRVALVIGNGDYLRVSKLANPPRDAADIARALERLDFKVTQLKNATAADMRKALVEFGRAAEGSAMAVVFYAGHGMEAGGENWLIPIDAELRSDADVESETVSLRSVSLQVSKARQLGLIILDACRNNPFAANMKRSLSTRAVVRGLAPTEPTDNVLIAYAARGGTTAEDGDGRNSPFTSALLRHIETPGLEISFLFRRVRDDVMAATKREQQPFVYGSLSKEEIYLKAPIAGAATEPASQSAAAVPDAGIKESANPDSKSTGRGLFTAEDSERVAAFGAELQLKMPPFTIATTQEDVSSFYSRFVGVWSSKRGWGNGKGRHGMLIIRDVSASGMARGYYLWGPSTKLSWDQGPAGYAQFAEFIDKDTLTLDMGNTITAKLDDRNIMTMTSVRKDKPSDRTSNEYYPIWQLAPQGRVARDRTNSNTKGR
jgi:hypothetical protein